jgi:NADH-quinone oxidoreductase subunit K
MTITLTHYMVLSGLLFTLGAVGVVARRNTIVIFMSIELMLNAANLALIAASWALGDMGGHVFVLMVMAVAAAEAGVGLAIILMSYRIRGTVNADEMRLLKW